MPDNIMPVKENYTYFDLDGLPCRILNFGDQLNMQASCYKKGVGFIDANIFDVTTEGNIISEAQFKEMVKALLLDR